jgi:hypothetical protein
MSNLPGGEPELPEPSGVGPSRRLTPAELDRAVQAADPAALLVRSRILRRVIKQDRQLTGFGLRVPHHKSYSIGREPLLEIVERAELGLAEDAALPEKVVLLDRPDARDLAVTPAEDILINCWRLLFHARVHVALEDLAASGRLSPSAVRRRIQRLGPAEFDEIRVVLGQEDLLLPPRTDASIYAEFVAMYLELRYFARSLVPRYFPGLEDLEAVDELVGQDVEAANLFQATRPHGAPDPKDHCDLAELAELPAEVESAATNSLPSHSGTAAGGEGAAGEATSATNYRRLMRKSQRPASRGNVVRAVVYRAKAERCAPPELVGRTRSAIKMDVYRLIRRLQAALELDDAQDQPWHESLSALVDQTPRGIWTAEARLLYDLQKACVDHERGIHTVDVVEWVLSWGHRPIVRPLPYQRDVLMLKHLRSAARLLDAVRLSDQHRRQLALLIHGSRERVEARLRHQLRPQITAALDEVGLVAQNLPETVARKKLIEELLDQVGERGFLTMGHLRDAISRNKLKLPDLSEPRDFFRGDQLLRADRRLSRVLDGVYRRGEFYLRWMQRLSSLGFGTRMGRFLTRFAVVPFGGSYVTVVFAHHVWEWISGAPEPPVDPEMIDLADTGATVAEEGFRLNSPTVVLILGLFLLCLVNSAAFRRAIGTFFKTAYHVFRTLVIEPIRWIVQSELLQQILHSRVFTLLFRFLIKPLIWTGLAWFFLLPKATTSWTSAPVAVAIFLAVNLLLNSRLGRNVEELAADWIVQAWRRFGLRMIVGLFWLVVDFFRGVLETVERLMYSVDEWLRFRSGEGGLWLVAKAALGLLWFFIAYVLRFCVNVLFEPQINPIKHFPVVTVGHKLLLGAYHPFAKLLETTMEPAMAWTVSFAVIWSLPGIFGFLVWELTANWRLYAANRRGFLFPVRIGAHGETMARLLKPGFHSGTVPKRFAKLRRAEHHARADGSWHAVHKHVQALNRVEASVRRYVEREFLELFAQSRCWQAPAVTLEEVRLGTNAVKLAIGCPDVAEANLLVALEVQSGWLVADVSSTGWVDRLLPHQRQVLATALLGLYKSAGVDLVRQQIEGQFPPPMPCYDIAAVGLVLWPDTEEDVEVVYDLHEEARIAPRSVRGLARRSLPTLERRQLVFQDVPVRWDDWVAIWNRDLAGQGHPTESVAPVRVLPEGTGHS